MPFGPRITLLAITALFFSRALAQATSPWLVRGGANFSWYSDPLGTGHGPKTGHAAQGVGGFVGLGHEWSRERDWGLAFEVDLAMRTAGYEFNESGYPASFLADGSDRGRRAMRSTVLEFPALLVYRGFLGLRLEGGPFAARLLNATEVWHGTRWDNGNEADLNEQVDRTNEMAPWEFGGMLGILVEGHHGLCMHLRYLGGFTNLDKAVGSSPSTTSQVQVALALKLPVR